MWPEQVQSYAYACFKPEGGAIYPHRSNTLYEVTLKIQFVSTFALSLHSEMSTTLVMCVETRLVFAWK